MSRLGLLTILVITVQNMMAQNCNAYLYAGDTLQYEACQIAEERSGWYQFAWEYQNPLERAIAHCPYFSYGYRHMSVAYLKSGDFINWKRLMDLAVKYNPREHLGYRGWCRYQFFRDYEGAIADIERLDSLTAYEIGYSASGAYHLHIARGLCYKALGNRDKAIQIMESQLAVEGYSAGAYDHLHLGVLYLESDRYKDALKQFTMQEKNNPLAECQYYKAMAQKALGLPYQSLLEEAQKQYQAGQKMFDGYTHQIDKIYMAQIEAALKI